MPPHIVVIPDTTFTLTVDGGETSATITREIWNDPDAAFLDTTTQAAIVLQILYKQGDGTFNTKGHPALEERWFRARVSKYLSTPDGGETIIETNEGTGGTQPFGTNSDLVIRDLAPHEGARIEVFAEPPGGRGIFGVDFSLSFLGNIASSPLSKYTALATGSGIVPADRQTNFRSLLDGAEVTADDTDTLQIAKGHLVYDGLTVTFLDSEFIASIADGDGNDLTAGQSYYATLSKDSTGADVVTKGPKTEAVLYPDVPVGNILVERFTVATADGAEVSISPTSLVGGKRYCQFHARAGTGLTVLISDGEAVSSTDIAPRLTHENPVAVTASATNRIWFLPIGTLVATTTDAEPVLGAFLICYAIAGVAAITSIVDARALVHRALTMWHLETARDAVFSEESAAEDAPTFGLTYLDDEGELEAVTLDLSELDNLWTAGALKLDVLYAAPGAAVSTAASIFTDAATHDERPVLQFDAADLRVESRFHQVRRFAKGTRFLFRLISTVTTSAPEDSHEVRIALHFRRYR